MPNNPRRQICSNVYLRGWQKEHIIIAQKSGLNTNSSETADVAYTGAIIVSQSLENSGNQATLQYRHGDYQFRACHCPTVSVHHNTAMIVIVDQSQHYLVNYLTVNTWQGIHSTCAYEHNRRHNRRVLPAMLHSIYNRMICWLSTIRQCLLQSYYYSSILTVVRMHACMQLFCAQVRNEYADPAVPSGSSSYLNKCTVTSNYCAVFMWNNVVFVQCICKYAVTHHKYWSSARWEFKLYIRHENITLQNVAFMLFFLLTYYAAK